MGLKAFSDAVADLLMNEAMFVDEITALIGSAPKSVLRANTPWERLAGHALPCFVIEQGDGKGGSNSNQADAGQVIGHQEQQFSSELMIALLWNEQDRDTAGVQRTELPGIFARLFLRNPVPGNCDGAWLDQWIPDRGVQHPRQTFVAKVHGEYTEEL